MFVMYVDGSHNYDERPAHPLRGASYAISFRTSHELLAGTGILIPFPGRAPPEGCGGVLRPRSCAAEQDSLADRPGAIHGEHGGGVSYSRLRLLWIIFRGSPDYPDLSVDISVTPVGGPNRHSNQRPLSPSHPCVTAAEIQAGEGGATCSGECAGEVLDSVNHDVYSLGVPTIFPELTEELVFMAGH